MEDQTINLNSDEDDNNKKKKAKKTNANKRKRRPSGGIGNEKAECWKYFTPKMERPDEPEGELIKMAYCNFCPQVYRADNVKNGTKNMNVHYVICEFNPMNEESLKQKKLCFTKKDNNGDGGTLQNWKYDENTIKKSLIELIILAELPFKFVEHPAFIKYSKSLQPKYNLPSRFTISRDVSKFYLEEKKRLLKRDQKYLGGNECQSSILQSGNECQSSIPVAHLFYSEILDVDKHLHEWERVPKFNSMVENMRLKYDKYWGDYKKINHYMYFAVLLDPTMKSEVLGYGFRHLMDNGCIPEENEDEVDTPLAFLTDNEKEDKVKNLAYEVETNMGVLFALYNEKYGTKVTHNSSDVQKSSTQSSNTTRRRGNTFLNSFKSQNSSRSSGVDDELKKYLKEPPLELDDEEEFDILSWWKMNSPRFPIVSKMAKDILSIQISTVASESAFSTSGRILDPYRNALSPQIVEALICTQSWDRTPQKSIYMDDLEDLVKDEEVIKEMKEVLDKLKEDNGKGISLD